MTRVLLVDDHPLVTHGLAGLLRDTGEFSIVGIATSAAEARALACTENPELVILDVYLGDALAPDVCRQLRADGVHAPVAILTAFYESETAIGACLREGVAGILVKDTSPESLLESLRDILLGKRVLDPRLSRMGSTTDPEIMRDSEGRTYDELTVREYDVLRLLARGLTTAEIAETLHLSVNTVRSYVQGLLVKLNARSRVEALATARRLRLV